MRKIVLLVSLFALLAGVQQSYSQDNKSASIVSIDGQNYYVHMVSAGETLYSLSRMYGVSEDVIKQNNPLVAALGLQTGQVVKVPMEEKKPLSKKKQNKLFEQHTVNKGETAYSISKHYGVTVSTLIEDNEGLTPENLSVGQILNIRKSSIGDQSGREVHESWEEYTEVLNSVSDDYMYHLVAQGETIYSISKQYGISEKELRLLNDLSAGLKAGTMVKIRKVRVDERDSDGYKSTETQPEGGQNVSVQGTGRKGVVNVAMFLPIQKNDRNSRNFIEFYQGALIALEDLKARGISVNLDMYNSERSASSVFNAVGSESFMKTNLIIGPVYEENMEPVVLFGEKMGVPVVSPLSTIRKERSSVIYQMSPSADTKYDKLRDMLTGDKNIVVISSANDDAEFYREISKILPSSAQRLEYAKSLSATKLEGIMKKDRENIYIVLSQKDSEVDEILARLSSVQNNMIARSLGNPSIKVIGQAKWLRFGNIDKNLFFKMRLNFVTSNHADRSNEQVLEFDKRYISAFSSIPTQYSYRGYDAVSLFVEAMAGTTSGADFDRVLNMSKQPLQMPYHFVQKETGDIHVNDQWALVMYNDDYTIGVK